MPFGGMLTMAAIGAAGQIGGSAIGSKSAKSAAKTQQQNAVKVANMAQDQANRSSGLINDATQNSLGIQRPYLDAGAQGVTSLAAALQPGGSLAKTFSAPDPNQVQNTPEYQFQLQQGTQALERSAAARGGLMTGGTLKGITQYGQGLASTAYQQAYNNAMNTFQTNHNNTLGGLLALTGVGQNAAGQSSNILMGGATSQANIGMQGMQIAGQALTGGSNAQAQGTINSGNAWSQGLGGVTNSITGAMGMNYMNNMMTQPGYSTAIGNGGPPNPSSYAVDGTAIYAG